ncbi:DEAD/DEAH box helicase, partial [Nostocoides japonicum]|uniref:DEAD/DEAH box helicase n=1 Tax=Nostocoides japonicum TaxID=99481 RepID=UPI0012FBB768
MSAADLTDPSGAGTEPAAGGGTRGDPGSLEALDTDDPDVLYEAFERWVRAQGLTMYPHQDEAVIELLAGDHVILATPTGSGKSLVATAAIFAALSTDRVAFYTAPIKALVSERFFALCQIFGADNVGMLTGDAAVNADAPIIACTAEVLANIALREGSGADVGLVVMDEFHYYAEPERGWAWHVPLLELPQAQFLLMSATLGDMRPFAANLRRHTGRDAAVVDTAERPVPLTFSWSVTPLQDTIEELLEWDRVPMYVVHPTQAGAADHAKQLQQQLRRILTPAERDAIAARIGGFRFSTGFGRTLSALLRKGIGVHHAGMLPRYRRLVEQLAQAGMLKVICGTDTLGVGINVPIRTVLFTGLAKFDGTRERVLRVREFRQIAGRAGRAGFDTQGYAVVQAPEHIIENARRLAKAGDDPVRIKRVQRVKPPEGAVVWTEKTFEKLTTADPEPLQSRMKVDDAMILNVVARPGDAVRALSRLTRESDWSRPGGEADPRTRARLARPP